MVEVNLDMAIAYMYKRVLVHAISVELIRYDEDLLLNYESRLN